MHNYSLIFNNTLEELPRVTQAIEKLLSEQHISTSEILDVVLVMEELFVNQVSYGYDDQQIHVINLDVTWDEADRVLTLVLRNDGIEFDILGVPDPDTLLSAEDRQIGGLGIFFVKQKMDFVSYERRDCQNIIVLKKNIK